MKILTMLYWFYVVGCSEFVCVHVGCLGSIRVCVSVWYNSYICKYKYISDILLNSRNQISLPFPAVGGRTARPSLAQYLILCAGPSLRPVDKYLPYMLLYERAREFWLAIERRGERTI